MWVVHRSIPKSSGVRPWRWSARRAGRWSMVPGRLGVSENTLHNWLKADRDARARANDPDALSESELVELKRLRRENIELRTDRKILRKAAAYFARETMR